MKKYLKPEISIEKLFSSETVAAADPFVDSNNDIYTDGKDDTNDNSVFMSTQTWWDDLVNGN